MKEIIIGLLAGLSVYAFINLAEARTELTEFELEHEEVVYDLNKQIKNLLEENERLSDMRCVNGVVSEY